MFHKIVFTFSWAFVAVVSATVSFAADPLATAFPQPKGARGVVVTVGLDETSGVVNFVRQAPVVVLMIPSRNSSAAVLNEQLAAAKVLGQATAADLTNEGRIPLAEWTAATVLLAENTPDEDLRTEVQRILRPYGTLWQRESGAWTSQAKPRPAEMDDWGHFHKDAAASEHSRDRLVGPARGLQWIAGPTVGQDYNLIMQNTVFTQHADPLDQPGSQQLIARDAFSGLPLWKHDLRPNNRFCIVATPRRVFVHFADRNTIQPYTVALDRQTGQLMREYRQGFDFTVTKEELQANRRAWAEQKERTRDLQLRVADGLLIQVLREGFRVLDVETGEKLWSATAAEGLGFVHPIVGDGVLFVAEGRYARRSSYTHWPMATPDRISAWDLKSGRSLWTFSWDENTYGKPHALYNLQWENDRLAGAVTILPPDGSKNRKPRPHGLILDATTGKPLYWGREEDAWPGNTGAGHSHVRFHLRGNTAWTFELGGPIARWSVGQPADPFFFKTAYKGNLRPVSCTVWRSTPDWWFGGIGCYPADGTSRGYFNNSGRSDCDIGAFPGNGLIYSPPNTCQCQPYLPGNKAYHSRSAGQPVPIDQRLDRGTARPAEVSNERNDPFSGWPQWRRDPARRAWSDETTPTDVQKFWQYRFEDVDVPDLLALQWRHDAIIRGQITQPSVAGKLAVVGIPHRHLIVGLDSATGQMLWQTRVDGRVDMAPSIHQGVVLAGTRNGYVYGLNRDTGELIWRFLAAPREDRILVNGQLESPWPVFGSLPVDDRGLIAVAGRHADSDGGLWWWQLDPANGHILDHGRLGGDEPPELAANFISRRPLDQPAVQNSVAVMTDRWFLLPGTNIRRHALGLGLAEETTKLSPASFATNEEIDAIQLTEHFQRPGRNALLGERPATVGGWRKPFYANTLARIFAIRGTDCVSVGGGLYTASGRGGGGDSKVHRLRLLEKPVNERRNRVRNMEVVWEYDDRLLMSRSLPSVSAMAVSNNAIYLGVSIYGKDKAWRDARAEMPHRLRILNLADGTFVRDVPLPGRVQAGGIAISGGRIYVSTDDGSLTAFTAK